MIDRFPKDKFAKDKIHYIAAFKQENSFFTIKEILAKGLDANEPVEIMQIRTQDDEKKLAAFAEEQLQDMGNTLLSIAAYQILNDDQKEIMQLLFLMGARDTKHKVEQLLEKQRKDWFNNLSKKEWDTIDLYAVWGEKWREVITKMIARIDVILGMFKLQWSFDSEWKINIGIRQNVINIFNNYLPRLGGMFSGKHTENITEAKNIIHYLEKNPELDYDGIAEYLLKIGEPTNPTGEFNRRLNYCFNKLGLTHKRLGMSSIRLLITPNEDSELEQKFYSMV